MRSPHISTKSSPCSPQLEKSPCAAMKTQHSQKKFLFIWERWNDSKRPLVTRKQDWRWISTAEEQQERIWGVMELLDYGGCRLTCICQRILLYITWDVTECLVVTKCQQGLRNWNSLNLLWKNKLLQLLWKVIWHALVKLKIVMSYNTATLLLDKYPDTHRMRA